MPASGVGGVGIDDEYAAVLGGADLELLSENAAAADTDVAGAVFAAAVVGENWERLSEAAAAKALAAVGESAVPETPVVDSGAEVFAASVVGANRERLSEAAAANALTSVAETPASKAAAGMPAAAKPDVAAAAAMEVSTESTLDSLSGGATAPSVVGVPALAAIGAGVVGNSAAAGKSSDEALSTPTRARVAAMASGSTDSPRFSGVRLSLFGLLFWAGTDASSLFVSVCSKCGFVNLSICMRNLVGSVGRWLEETACL